MKIILASGSPRRLELMKLLPFDFEVFIPKFDEEKFKEDLKNKVYDKIDDQVLDIAKEKGNVAFNQLYKRLRQDCIIISADTVVIVDDEILEKGRDVENSIHILKKLNGKKHRVVTGVSIRNQNIIKSFSVSSDVYFGNIDDSLIEYYVNEYKPFDKAGAYGIQDGGGIFVEKIKGSYHNIVGLPIREVYLSLKNEFGIDIQNR